MKQSKIRLSQCMIVKDEEKNIRQALSWGKDIAWEQIVVDTGSTDRTVELAESMGAKVYHFSWIDDFAAAKNFAISKASGDWIAFLDADEFITEEWAEKLLSALEELDAGGYCALRSPWVCIDKAGNITSVSRHSRFFKRMPELVYQRPIHEILTLEGVPLSGKRVADAGSDFPVYHTGYQPEAMNEKKKRQRNIRLLEKELEKHPEDYHIMGYLGDSYNQGADGKKEAEYWYRRAISFMPDLIHTNDERSAMTFVYLLLLLSGQKDEEALLAVYAHAKKSVPWVYDCDFVVARFYLLRKSYEKAAIHLELALQVVEQYGADAYGVYMSADIAELWEHLALCYYETNKLSACVHYCVTLLKTDNRRLTALRLLLQALRGEKPEDVIRFLGSLYDIHQVSERLFLLKGAILAGADSVIESLRAECTPEELDFIEQAKRQMQESGS